MAGAMEQIESAQAPLDLVVFNAVVYEPLPGGLADPEMFRRHMEVNCLGLKRGLMTALRQRV